jgi:branched-subunit amino acid transport protein
VSAQQIAFDRPTIANQAVTSRAAAYVVAVVLLCLPALWNGFPLMYDDVGGYLERWPTRSLGLGRSTVYGLLLWLTRSAAFVPVIVLQALVTVFVVDRAIKVFVGLNRPWLLPGVIAAIAVTSGVALFVSKAIPDAWAAPGVLALHLLAWGAESPTKSERVMLAAIVAFAGATHMATFGVMAGLSVLYAIAWLLPRRLALTPPGMPLAVAAVWSGLLLLQVGNVIVAGRLAVARAGWRDFPVRAHGRGRHGQRDPDGRIMRSFALFA